MSLILVDTSVWIDFFQGRPTRESEVLSALLQDDSAICICPIILQEILQGIGSEEVFNQVSDSLQQQIMLACPPAEAAVGAAQLYRKLRKAGVTIRKSNDCLIAYHAIFYDAALLQCDRDFQLMVPHTQLKLL